MSDILRQLVLDNDDGDDTLGRLDDMTVAEASHDLTTSILLLNPSVAQFDALRDDIHAVLMGSAIEIHHEISGHVVTADWGESGHDNEFTVFVDGVRILRADTNFILRLKAA